MARWLKWLAKPWFLLRAENLHRVLVVIVLMVLLGAAGLAVFEPNTDYPTALWWSIVTLTTVGYGDVSPATLGGRVVGVALMLVGIGVLGMLTGTLASLLVERRTKEDRGMSAVDVEDHLILCEWNNRARDILKELRVDSRAADTDVVLIADLEHKPVDDEHLYFVAGSATEETLQAANLSAARTVIVLGDSRLELAARDAKVVLAALTIEALAPEAYSIVELSDEANVKHCQRAKVDEIIVTSEFNSRLISRAAMDHGISRVLQEVLSSNVGSDLLRRPLPQDMVGQDFLSVLSAMKRDHGATVVAVQNADETVLTNPPTDYELTAGDALIVIAPS